MADINLQVGAGNKFGAISLLDNTNNVMIPATFSNVSISNSNPAVATLEAIPPTPNIKATPIIAGTGTVVISILCNYTDPGDNQPKSETLSITKTFDVLAAPHGARLQITFT